MPEIKKNLQLVSLHQVAKIIGCSYGTMKRTRYQAGFPEPIVIGGLTRWVKSEIEDWLLTLRK